MPTRMSAPPLWRLRHVVRTTVAEHPAVYLPFARRKYPGPSPQVIGPDTELVIDGYTRCGSTFAVYAFQLAQPRPVHLAHHLHAPAQLIAAAKAGIPALAVIREPEGAILSQLVREPRVALPDVLMAYARFYERLLPYRPRLVVADFDEVTQDFGAVVRRVNERFGTTFATFEPTEANLRECMELIRERPNLSPTLLGFESGMVTLAELRTSREREAAAPAESGRNGARDVWVPSADRDRAKAALRREWLSPALDAARARARRRYEDFTSRQKAGAA